MDVGKINHKKEDRGRAAGTLYEGVQETGQGLVVL